MALIYPSRRRSGFENMLKEQCLRQMQLQALTFFFMEVGDEGGQQQWGKDGIKTPASGYTFLQLWALHTCWGSQQPVYQCLKN